MSLFDFKRGNTVRICLLEYDKIGHDAKVTGVSEAYGIVLEVSEKEIEVRRDNDGALFTASLNGQKFDFNNNQFLQVQKCFLPVSSYKGTLVEWLTFIAHPSEHEDCIKMTVLGVVDGKSFCQESEDHFMDSKIMVDLSKSRGY